MLYTMAKFFRRLYTLYYSQNLEKKTCQEHSLTIKYIFSKKTKMTSCISQQANSIDKKWRQGFSVIDEGCLSSLGPTKKINEMVPSEFWDLNVLFPTFRGIGSRKCSMELDTTQYKLIGTKSILLYNFMIKGKQGDRKKKIVAHLKFRKWHKITISLQQLNNTTWQLEYSRK